VSMLRALRPEVVSGKELVLLFWVMTALQAAPEAGSILHEDSEPVPPLKVSIRSTLREGARTKSPEGFKMRRLASEKSHENP